MDSINAEKMQDENKKSGFVTILGRPNVGKSTIMNALIGEKVAIVSPRAQTTRKHIQTVYTDKRGQIVFLDTPGVTKAETKLEDFMDEEILGTLKTADAAVWIIEPSTFIGAGERKLIDNLKKTNLPLLLVINKADLADETKINATIETYLHDTKAAGVEIKKICAVSAKNGFQMDYLMQSIYDILPFGPMYYDEDTLTDETEREIAAEYIREKCLNFLDKEIPHGIAVVIEQMHERIRGNGEPIIDVEAAIICERETHKGILIGKNGSMLKKIGSAARHDMERMLDCQVNLKIWVKVRPGWRDNIMNLKEFGYAKTKK